MIEKIAIEISLLNHAAAEREPEHAKYLNIFTKSVFVKLMMMITGSAYISPEVGVKAGAEPIRILDTHLASMYIFWPAHPCRLFTLTDHLESHEDPFYNENGCLLTSAFTGFASTKSWKERARAFIIDIWRQLDEQTEVDLADLPIGPIEDLQVDPSLLNRSLSLGSATSFGIEEEMSRFENMNLNEWSLFVRIFESQNIVENRTNMIKEFWNNRKTDFPRLAQVATYICAINASSSNIERLFSHASAKTRDPTKNRLLMKTVELSLQQKLGPAFIEIINDIMQFIGSR